MLEAESVFLNGVVHTADPAGSTVQAVAVSGGRIVWAGSDDQAKKYIARGTKVYDFGGAAVIPGIIESHLHPLMLGESLLLVECFKRSKADIIAAVAAAYKRDGAGKWIIGRGWNELDWDDATMPTKAELDAVAPDAPVCLVRACGHISWNNSAALAAAGISRDTPDPFGGEIYHDASGEPTGILSDTAYHMVERLFPPMTEARRREAYLASQELFLRSGITAVSDLAATLSDDYGNVEFVRGLYRDGSLKIGVSIYVASTSADEAYKVGPEVGLFGGQFNVRGIKFFTDGSLGARSAWLLDDYADRPGHRGNGRYEDAELFELIRKCRENGFQAATHAIGDAANRQVLDAYEHALAGCPEPKDHRFRIEHSQIINERDLRRFGELGVVPSMQFIHCTSDMAMTEERIGHDRLVGAYAWRTMRDMGLPIPNGSDAPVELVDPFHGFYAAIARKDRLGKPEGGWRAEQCLTRDEALRAMTIWGAYATFEDLNRGSIQTGKRADFVVLDRDVMTCPADETKDTTVRATVLGGEVAHGTIETARH